MLKVHELPMSLGKASRTIHRYTEACCRKYGITAYQYVLLFLLAEEDGVTQQQLVERADSDPNTMRAMLVLLEKHGMIKRNRHISDNRKRHVVLTKKGRKTYENAFKETEPIRKNIHSNFNADELKMLKIFLNRITESLEGSDILNHNRLKK